MNAFAQFHALILAEIDALAAEGELPAGLDTSRVAVEPPREASHGDMATNVAMVLAKPAGVAPKTLAEKLAARLRKLADVTGVEIAGPFNPNGVSKTPSRALIFICDPSKTGESVCARRIAENLARRAFRRPVTTEDMKRLMPFYEAGRRNSGTFDQGIEQVVAAVLVSPQFLAQDENVFLFHHFHGITHAASVANGQRSGAKRFQLLHNGCQRIFAG